MTIVRHVFFVHSDSIAKGTKHAVSALEGVFYSHTDRILPAPAPPKSI